MADNHALLAPEPSRTSHFELVRRAKNNSIPPVESCQLLSPGDFTHGVTSEGIDDAAKSHVKCLSPP